MRRLNITVLYYRIELQSKELMVPEREGPSGVQSLRVTPRLHIPHPNWTHPGKTHYRMVLEKGITIDLVPSLRHLMRALADTVTSTSSPGYSQP